MAIEIRQDQLSSRWIYNYQKELRTWLHFSTFDMHTIFTKLSLFGNVIQKSIYFYSKMIEYVKSFVFCEEKKKKDKVKHESLGYYCWLKFLFLIHFHWLCCELFNPFYWNQLEGLCQCEMKTEIGHWQPQ